MQLLSGGKDMGKTKASFYLKAKSTRKTRSTKKKPGSMKFQEPGIKVTKKQRDKVAK